MLEATSCLLGLFGPSRSSSNTQNKRKWLSSVSARSSRNWARTRRRCARLDLRGKTCSTGRCASAQNTVRRRGAHTSCSFPSRLVPAAVFSALLLPRRFAVFSALLLPRRLARPLCCDLCRRVTASRATNPAPARAFWGALYCSSRAACFGARLVALGCGSARHGGRVHSAPRQMLATV